MGYWTDSKGIEYFTPDDDENTIYIPCSASMYEIILSCQSKWGADIDMCSIKIEAERIHTDCIGYDLYDPADYTDYLVIRKINE